jgi:uncharacterized membrane protein (UPF0127 family)
MTRFRFTRRLRNAPRTAAILLACLAPVGIVVAAADDPPAPPATPEPSAPPPKSDPSRIDPARPLPFKILRKSPKGLLVIPLQVQGQRFEVELAANDTSRRRGLGGRTRLLPGTGMLFVHTDDEIRGYWMYDCLIDIDVAFLDQKGRIVAMHRMKREAPRRASEYQDMYQRRLKRYTSLRPARYALELPPGDLSRLKLEIGQTIHLPKSELDKLAR